MKRINGSHHPEAVDPDGRRSQRQEWSRIDRRGLIAGVGAGLLMTGVARATQPPLPRTMATPAFEALERRLGGGQLGVYATDLIGGEVRFRPGQPFAMCSTFKYLLAAAVLEKVEAGKLTLDRMIHFGQADLLEYAPVTGAHVREGAMSVADLAAAAVELSDNTAANLLLPLVGGPSGLTARFRAWGDTATRLDRNEPELNSATPGDLRDTTTPVAMVRLLNRVLFEEVAHPILGPESRDRLETWMINCQTGASKLRAGLPKGVIVGDKTGNNGRDTEGDVAFVRFPGRRPILIAVYVTGAKVDPEAQDTIIAEAGRLVMLDLNDQAPKRGDPAFG